MSHFPDLTTFSHFAKDHCVVPVYRQLFSDLLTPVTAFHCIDNGGSACLFESVIGGEKVGRYSFLASEPFMELKASQDRVSIKTGHGIEEFTASNPLDILRQRIEGLRSAKLPGLPPFAGGAVGYAGYDVVRYVERLPDAPHDDRKLPDLQFSFYDRMVIFDNITKTMFVVAMARVAKGERSERVREIYHQAQQRVDQLVAKLSATPSLPSTIDLSDEEGEVGEVASNFRQDEFEDRVRRCVEYIHAGDIFQVVISQRLKVPVKADSFEIYRTLRVVNPSPFMFFLRSPEVTLVGSSPEIMCRVMDNEVTVRPLAGTRRRGKTEEEDRRLAEELLADPKERAEHVMLVDLGRNDVGRIAKYGTVKLSDVMTIERYSHVMHISSNVTGQLRDGMDAFDALQSSLPAGTVSGAPKVRAMQIIDEMEPHRRGPYAGAVGYLDYVGNMDTCIALRTIVIQNGIAYVQAGAGIVADSQPKLEYQETLNKARGLLKAIHMTERRVSAHR